MTFIVFIFTLNTIYHRSMSTMSLFTIVCCNKSAARRGCCHEWSLHLTATQITGQVGRLEAVTSALQKRLFWGFYTNPARLHFLISTESVFVILMEMLAL